MLHQYPINTYHIITQLAQSSLNRQIYTKAPEFKLNLELTFLVLHFNSCVLSKLDFYPYIFYIEAL
jgi:hypothetical protein